MGGKTEYCKYCKSFSAASGVRKAGFCLKRKTSVQGNGTCSHWKQDMIIEYQQEYKNASSAW